MRTLEDHPIASYPKGSTERLADHFVAKDFDCPCLHPDCKGTLIDDDLVLGLQLMRDNLGMPLRIDSAYRCKFHQEMLRESENYQTAKGTSTHELGQAADVSTGHHTGKQLEEIARRVGFKAVGVASNWVHVDLRRDRDRSWTYS